jgi:hypothetical protein
MAAATIEPPSALNVYDSDEEHDDQITGGAIDVPESGDENEEFSPASPEFLDGPGEVEPTVSPTELDMLGDDSVTEELPALEAGSQTAMLSTGPLASSFAATPTMPAMARAIPEPSPPVKDEEEHDEVASLSGADSDTDDDKEDNDDDDLHDRPLGRCECRRRQLRRL